VKQAISGGESKNERDKLLAERGERREREAKEREKRDIADIKCRHIG
jgi:hypothetical protein